MEGRLILPEQAKSNVVFEMRNSYPTIAASDIVKVFVGSSHECCDGKSPMAGSYSIDGQAIVFTPAFDFLEGQNYSVEIFDIGSSNEGNTRFVKQFTIKRTVEYASPEVVAIYPSGSIIPENTLRFYIHFSTPMKPHVSNQFIKLLDSSGTSDDAAFMAFKQELWSEDRKRLTLLIDPGRIKRGVAQNLTLGSALQEGNRYSIVVEEGWPTANDAATMPRFEHIFTVAKPLRTIPEPSAWTIKTPRRWTNDPLVIEFDRPFDYEQLRGGISVSGEDGRAIPGVISIENQEQAWRFEREGLWRNDQIHIFLDTELEDVAGNNLVELLDHSVNTKPSGNPQNTITLDLKTSVN